MTSTYLAWSAVFPAKSALATDEESAMKLCPTSRRKREDLRGFWSCRLLLPLIFHSIRRFVIYFKEGQGNTTCDGFLGVNSHDVPGCVQLR